ncbi:cilia- and flagella-associated protein 44-like [Saccostrea cucullata]|uniref:cilia- and flagella-associated protein 44-like n=1 Tax=Saccostrea cuccullata TaxID=36930 RepID=UPI002ED0456B
MDDEKKKKDSHPKGKKTLSLRGATHKLKAEALRRYRLKHKDDVQEVKSPLTSPKDRETPQNDKETQSKTHQSDVQKEETTKRSVIPVDSGKVTLLDNSDAEVSQLAKSDERRENNPENYMKNFVKGDNDANLGKSEEMSPGENDKYTALERSDLTNTDVICQEIFLLNEDSSPKQTTNDQKNESDKSNVQENRDQNFAFPNKREHVNPKSNDIINDSTVMVQRGKEGGQGDTPTENKEAEESEKVEPPVQATEQTKDDIPKEEAKKVEEVNETPEPGSEAPPEKAGEEKPEGTQEKTEEGEKENVVKEDQEKTEGGEKGAQEEPEGEKKEEDKPAQESGSKEEESSKKPEEEATDKPAEEKKADGEEKAADDQTKPEDDQKTEDKPKETAEGEKPKETGEGDTNQNAAEGDEQDEEGEKKAKKEEEEKKKIPDDFFYNYEDLISQPQITQDSGLPKDYINLAHSFGYDCTKRHNLHLLDERTVCFAAGNYVLLLDLQTKEQKYLRSTSGGGIGAITVHPSKKYFAVAEKGTSPNINIFEYPSLKLHRILRGGTERSYSYVDFNPKGDLLASVGGDPDYMLTIWDWKEEQTVLRSKAFSQEVFRVTFSTELEGQLTTAGTGHIRFWKMADTFTGLKLQGELGKFGKTEISDIEGYVELPDGKVLSGTESGNMLLWEGGLIKVEIGRKGKKMCHHGSIQQILLDEGELMTVGMDGFIRVWDFESVDTADVADESGLFEMEPMNELRVGHDVHLKSILKSTDAENEVTVWYAQDANGGIWKLDLTFSHTSQAPDKLFSYHAGAITGCDVSPLTHLVATTGVDHTVRVFDFLQKKQLYEKRFADAGTALIWAPQIVDPKAKTIIAGFSDGVVRIMSIAKANEDQAHKKHKHDIDLDLDQVFKPHTKAVTSLAVNDKGDILASGGADNTIFFMNIGKTYEPIGFIETPAAVRQVQWSPSSFKKSTLLVFCEDGLVLEVDSPDGATFDTSKTFHITGLPVRSYKFKSIKSRLRHEEELERKRIEEEERKKKEEEERRKRIERGLETESEQGDIEEDKLQPGEFDAGYMYECKFTTEEERSRLPEELQDAPLQSIPVTDSNDVPITFMQYSGNGRQILFGMEDGGIRIQGLEKEFSMDAFGPHWKLNFHDNNYGHVVRLGVSPDEKMLVSVGADGNFFLYDIMEQEKVDQKVAEAKAKLPSAKKSGEQISVDDIEDPNAYSIEDAKQKAEHDKMMKIADEKKKEVRRQIAKLRRQFKSILEQNEGLPVHLQLKKEEFELDREIKLELEKQKTDRIDLVRKELAWEAEKQRVALEKLRKRYKDVVECERIVVKAFKTPHEVASFRAAKLSDDFYQMKAEFERRKTMTMVKDDITRDPTRDLLGGKLSHSDEHAGSGGKPGDQTGTKLTTTLKGSMGERINKALHKVEEKKQKRAARRAQWEELYNTKPDDDYEDPADLAAIKEAKDNMGDFKLKTAKDYVVPDHLRMNVEKARGRLLILKDLIHEHKYNFNLRLLKIRDKKLSVIEEIRELVAQLGEVQTNLDKSKHKPIPPVPKMYPDEMPEKKLEYTRDTLLAFKKEMEVRAKEAKGGGGFGGFGGFGNTADTAKDKGASPTPKPSTIVSDSKAGEDDELEEIETSPLELQMKESMEIKMLYEQDRLLGRIEELLLNFDAELRLLRHDKFRLDIVMKNADLRQVTLFEEFVLLKEYEKREDVMEAKVSGKQQEKLEMQAKIIELQGKQDMKKKEIEKLQEREKQLYAQFQLSLGENNKFTDYLTKVFKKKIKRSKKKVTDGEGSDEDSDEDSDDESDWDEDDEESEEEGGYDLDICPPGCDQNIYDNTCQLREKKLDIEEALQEEKKNNEALRKETDSNNKKLKVVDGALKAAQNDLEAFQLEKQQKLNELDVVVTLKLHQIQYIINGILPQDLSQTLVFESHGVTRLQQRIKELEHEKHMQKKHMKESRRKHVQLIKDRKVFDSKISEMEERTNEMMIAKFGRIVDLEKLETITVNRQIEELKEKLRLTEIQCAEELEVWDEKIAEKKAKITALIRDNTNRLDQLCLLLNEKKSYESELDSRQKNSGQEYTGARKADIRERQRLIQLVQLQAQEIDALKEEIMLLSRKGGHILPPAQPPLPQSPPNMRTISN